MKRIGKTRRKTRSKFKKSFRQRGKISLANYFQLFNVGDKVTLAVEPSIQKGMYNPKYLGKTGIIKRKNGRCYEVTVQDHKKEKSLIVHPVHLKRL